MKNLTKVYEVTYTKNVGGNGTIIVKAMSETDALVNAKQHCFTGSLFRDAKEVDQSKYSKPISQGFQGSGRAK